MIPKSLLTIFLSLQSLEQPSLDSSSKYDVKVIDNLKPTIDTHYRQVSLSNQQDKEVVIQAQTKYPVSLPCQPVQLSTLLIYVQFDSLASGDWNNQVIVDGVQITNNATSRLWSLPDAFPNLKPLHGGTKAWGPCKYLDVAHTLSINLESYLASYKIIPGTADS